MGAPAGFEWDDAKATYNYGKHGVSFEVATGVFRDRDRLDVADMRFNYGEDRRIATGMVQGVCLTVAFTVCANGNIRIISARPASRKERRTYGDHF
jgi:uncharacterized DUF497 family protein